MALPSEQPTSQEVHHVSVNNLARVLFPTTEQRNQSFDSIFNFQIATAPLSLLHRTLTAIEFNEAILLELDLALLY